MPHFSYCINSAWLHVNIKANQLWMKQWKYSAFAQCGSNFLGCLFVCSFQNIFLFALLRIVMPCCLATALNWVFPLWPVSEKWKNCSPTWCWNISRLQLFTWKMKREGKCDCSYSCPNRTKDHSFYPHLKIVKVHMNLFKKNSFWQKVWEFFQNMILIYKI